MNRYLLTAILLFCFWPGLCQAESKMVIARTGSAAAPPDTLTSIALAHAQGAGTIELNVVASRDSKVLLLSDPVITRTTDVQQLYPDRKRADGDWYTADFTYTELRQLARALPDSGSEGIPSNPYPPPQFSIATLGDALGLIRALDTTRDNAIQLFIIIRKNWQNREMEPDLSTLTIKILDQFGYAAAEDGASLGSYDPEELRRIRKNVLPAVGSSLPLLQLIDDIGGTEHMDQVNGTPSPYDYDWMFTKFGLKALSSYADGIGFPHYLVQSQDAGQISADYLEAARLLGLKRFFYPVLRASPDAFTAKETVEHLLFEKGLDGLATTDAAAVQAYLLEREQQNSESNRQQRSIQQLIEDIRSKDPSRNTPLTPVNP